MSSSRLSLAVESGQLELPSEGLIAVFSPSSVVDLSVLPRERVQIITGSKPEYDAFRQAGYEVSVKASEAYAAAIVCLPRAKIEARSLIAQAVAASDLVLVDGQKTDGVASIMKDCRKRASVEGAISKAHGKLFWFSCGDFTDWNVAAHSEIDGGFITSPGVFSADGVDPASAALVAALPAKLGRQVADLGAGWGYLSQSILKRTDVETLYLVEANHAALECARVNVTDDRADFHWADATTWEPRAKMNAVVMNPPFHTGRAADPSLGRAFILAAARMLAPNGQLWMVANRHLPYEAALNELFAKVTEVTGDNRFKIFCAERPTRTGR
ncbi:class I SAM-dependent methyltransferase [Cognatishimia maritima]|uniref:16S rRNA m(2)G 1207 methyltransferase n=1 Tax=Cognatishimia maritima TaxID=870908 RepID=A0A1M5RLR1_9RHOB|nr:class I SAM-dependent methyltransferase [Cognatishimia maritima]SHH27130.1 16S rRNA m(2)G 1207 methyltransferase [Cognatishimia maritima]